MPFVHLHNVSYHRGGVRLFHRLSLKLSAGECVIVRGANGSGKTTLLRLACGLLPLQQGTRRTPPLHAPHALWLGHRDGLTPRLSIRHNLEWRSQLWNLSRDSVSKAIKECQLQSWQETPVNQLSAGQRQKVAIASLTMPANPALWLLDEPEQHLDAHNSAWLHQCLARHCERGGGLLMATHHPPPIKHRTIQL